MDGIVNVMKPAGMTSHDVVAKLRRVYHTKKVGIMNVCFVMAEGYENLQDEFMAFAKERGMVGIKGHRSVGGFRASIYNACPKESVQALVDCMKEFEQLHK